MSGASGSNIQFTITANDKTQTMIDRLSRRLSSLAEPAQKTTRAVAGLGDTNGVSRLTQGM